MFFYQNIVFVLFITIRNGTVSPRFAGFEKGSASAKAAAGPLCIACRQTVPGIGQDLHSRRFATRRRRHSHVRARVSENKNIRTTASRPAVRTSAIISNRGERGIRTHPRNCLFINAYRIPIFQTVTIW